MDFGNKTYVRGAAEVAPHTYYDTAALATGGKSYSMFRTPMSSTKSQAKTNMRDTNLGKGRQFYLQGIRVALCLGNLALAGLQAVQDFISNSTISLKIDNKDAMGPWNLAQFFGPFQVMPTALATDNVYLPFYGDSKPMVLFGNAQPIDEQIGIEVLLENFETSGISSYLNAKEFKVFLEGSIRKAV